MCGRNGIFAEKVGITTLGRYCVLVSTRGNAVKDGLPASNVQRLPVRRTQTGRTSNDYFFLDLVAKYDIIEPV